MPCAAGGSHEQESRYTPDELAEIYYRFMRDPQIKARMEQENFDHWAQTELMIRFLGYVRKYEVQPQRLNIVKQILHRKNIFKEPMDGTLFKE